LHRRCIEAAEKQLDAIDAPPAEKEVAAGVLRRMGEAGGAVATDAVSSLLATAVCQVLGLA